MNSLRLGSASFTPSKVVCIGRNYLEHIRELGNETPDTMVIFNKPNSSISHTLRATHDEPLHYEGEICFMVRAGKLHAVGFGLDLTRRELQSRLKAKGLPWERAKAFDGAACFSDFVLLDGIEIESLSLQLEINGELRQDGGYELMLHKPGQVLLDIQQFMTLEDDDIIMTGTPKGVGQVTAGDHFVGRIKSGDEVLISREWLAE
ncbi:MAG: fumarylacetoacetate hydrolase family protein [Gammaproteobacteria bacterium]|nr:fumarylacetoacetate hydrolase family protein [Gammaproteobacteria bacterium]MDH3859019.1 fumarylacetoacetate hydrolase family protein [Gammaproteobacteria bacterium]